MSNKMFNREILRSIRSSLGRFVAIVGIVALGCGFYAGLRMTCPDMLFFADEYYDDTNLMDVRVVATLGLSDEDMDDLKKIPGVAQAVAAYETDVIANLDGDQYEIRVHSLTEGISALEVDQGRLPEKKGECVLSADKVMGTKVDIGDKIDVIEEATEDALSTKHLTVVGFVHSPYYVSSVSMGVTTLGAGTIQQYMYVTDKTFSKDYPITEAFLEVEGAKDEFAGSPGYQGLVDKVMDDIELIAPECEKRRMKQVVKEAQDKVDDARKEYEKAKAEADDKLGDAWAQLSSAKSKIDTNEKKLKTAKSDYDTGVSKLEAAEKKAFAEIDAAKKKIKQGEKELSAGKSQVAQQRAQFEASKAMMPPQQAAVAEAQIQAAEKQIASQEAKLQASKAEVAANEKAAKAKFEANRKKLESARKDIKSGESKLDSAKAQYEDGMADYESAQSDAMTELADAKAELDDAQKKVDDLADDLDDEWLVMDRTKNHGVESFRSDAERVDHIAQVFPFIFFLVAALVALTTMTRMVDEERMLIGTFKALGYSRGRITSKYILYALLASGVGAVLGIIALSLILPPVIMEAYAIIYYVPHGIIMPIDPGLALLSAALGIGVTLLSTWFACVATLRESPAALMLPRSPSAGKRILVERFRPLWSRLSFLWKVTLRNIFRYKKRFVMTVIGIAGCTALLLTGLGLQDSINDIIDKQFGATVKYNVVTTFEDGKVARENVGEAKALVEEGTFALEQNVVPIGKEGKEYSATLIVPEDPAEFMELWNLRERTTGEVLDFGEGCIINEKLAYSIGLKVGDTITIADQDDMGNATNDRRDVVVDGIMENYIANYVFMSPEAYRNAFHSLPEYASVFGRSGGERHEELAESLHGIEGVKTVAFNDETIDTYRTMLKSVNMIVVVLVVAAAALAFIVLYNLTNINITERAREIATLKVLGFTKREVYLYIFRETIILTVIGALAGLLLGILLEGFVVVTAEVDYVMFGREIHPISFVVGFLLTLVFSLVVMLFMRKKLDDIDMVESLKANE